MKVLLVNPLWPRGRAGRRRFQRAWPPLDLLIAAAELRRRGHLPWVLDLRAASSTADQRLSAARWAEMIVLQTTPMDRWQCPDLDLNALTGLASAWPTDRLVVAGAHGTLKPELILNLTKAKALIRGEPDLSIADLADAQGSPHGLAGLSYHAGEHLIHEPDRPWTDLADLPAPAYDLVNLKRYRYELLGPRLALLETSRGCPYSCTFCLKAMYGPRVRTKPLARIFAEIEELLTRHHARNLYFMDLEFTANRRAVADLCRELIRWKRKFSWTCQTRLDAVDPDLLALMKSAGCSLIHFGIESGSERILSTVNKKLSMAQAGRALQWCEGLGLRTACFFLFGLPGETSDDRRATMSMARQLNPTFASFHIAAPYPGTVLGRLTTTSSPFPACLNPRNMVDLTRDIRRAFLSFYLRPGYLIGRPGPGRLNEHWQRLRLFWEFIR
ncbi:MAG: radical SAM protein [Deltaproteobacteria bacterium]|nr:radical SAM protein [Deltaproteobacteria bacterium]